MSMVVVQYLGVKDPHVLRLPYLSEQISFLGGFGATAKMSNEDAFKLRAAAPLSYAVTGFAPEEQEPSSPVEAEPPVFTEEKKVEVPIETPVKKLTEDEQIDALKQELRDMGVALPSGRPTIKRLKAVIKKAKDKK